MPMAFYKANYNLIWITFLAVSMAFVESAVVIYLRELYYPSGFDFPMVSMPGRIALTEVLREIATLIMLLAMGFLAGKNALQRFAWFIYSFAIWDLFYYAFLKLIIDWPSSWFTWDILFLVPVVWTGPVLAPVLVSFTMIILAFTILYIDQRQEQWVINWLAVFLIVLGSLLIFVSFIWDFSSFVVRHSSFSALLKFHSASSMLQIYVPGSFNWYVLLAGEIPIFLGIIILVYHHRLRISDNA
jgi:hypothetical protein